MTPLEQLARDVLDMLRLRKEADSSKLPDQLRKAKRKQEEVVAACKGILHPKQTQTTMFEETPENLF